MFKSADHVLENKYCIATVFTKRFTVLPSTKLTAYIIAVNTTQKADIFVIKISAEFVTIITNTLIFSSYARDTTDNHHLPLSNTKSHTGRTARTHTRSTTDGRLRRRRRHYATQMFYYARHMSSITFIFL